MRAPIFKKWFAKLASLNLPQRLQTLAALHRAAGLDRVISLIASAAGGRTGAGFRASSTASWWRVTAAARRSTPSLAVAS